MPEAKTKTGAIRLTKDQRKALLARIERESSRAQTPERILQRGEQALKAGKLDQAERMLRQLESTAPELAGLEHFRDSLETSRREHKRRANVQATEEMLTRYIQQRKKPLAELALQTLIEIAPNHRRRHDFEMWVADLDQELKLQALIDERLEAGRDALRRGDTGVASRHLDALRKVDPISDAVEKLAAEIERAEQGQAESADIERARSRLEELLAAGDLEEAEAEVERLAVMDLPKVTIDFLYKRLAETRRRLRDQSAAEEIIAAFERSLAEREWQSAREAAHRFGQRFPADRRGGEMFSRVTLIEAEERRQQSVEEGIATFERFLAEGKRHDAELALKLLKRLAVDADRLAALEKLLEP